jgi:hypothetical protein
MSGLQKNTAGQKWRVFAFDTATNTPVTGGAAAITAKLAKDWGVATALGDTNPTEVEDGFYLFDLTQAETNANWLDLYPESGTAGVQVIGVPGSMGTIPAALYTVGAVVDDIKKMLRADVQVDTTTTPWELVLLEEGTGVIGVGTELLRQPLKTVTGADITTTTAVIGRAGL